MRSMAGPSTVSVSFVQSPLAATRICGRGAAAAAISMLEYSTRSPGSFSHEQPPCMVCETITIGACAASRSSTAPSMNVCAARTPCRAARGEPILHRAEHDRLRASARFPGARQPRPVHVRQAFEEVERADAVPRLEPHQVDTPEQVDLVRGEMAVRQIMLVRRHIAAFRKERVVIAHHVVGKRDHPLTRKVDATGRRAAVFVVREPAFFPVPVRVENRRKRTLAAPDRMIQVPREVEAGQRLKIDLLHAVALALDSAEHMPLKRGLLRHRPQAAAYQHLLANLLRARLPFLP